MQKNLILSIQDQLKELTDKKFSKAYIIKFITPIIEYIVEIVNRTREDPRVKVGSSPRGAQSLFKLSRALAVLNGRDYVLPDDIKRLSIYTLRHRIILKPEPRIKGVQTEEIISQILEEVEVPTTQGQLED